MADRDLLRELRRRVSFTDGHADVWPLFYDAALFARILDALGKPLDDRVSKVAGIEARGFLLGGAVAARLNVGFVAIRKQPGLFPGPKLTETTREGYRGTSHLLRLQQASCGPGDMVALVDDWFETGSQALAAKALIQRAGARFAGASIIVDQLTPSARDLLAPCHALISADLLG